MRWGSKRAQVRTLNSSTLAVSEMVRRRSKEILTALSLHGFVILVPPEWDVWTAHSLKREPFPCDIDSVCVLVSRRPNGTLCTSGITLRALTAALHGTPFNIAPGS